MIKDSAKKHIPIFFSSDDNYMPYLDIAISSLIANASKDYEYRIIILNTGLCEENIAKVKQNECKGFKIDFFDISKFVEDIKSRFKSVYHFSIVTYYRLFIASIFTEYEKIIYLDCDLVVLGDISKLYSIDPGDNIFCAVPDVFVKNTSEFRRYTSMAIGIDPEKYINAGVLLLNLKNFRENHIEEKFIKLITEYDFDLLDPDQAYLNYLCRDKILHLENSWNNMPGNLPSEGEKNIVHYALYKKPWQYDDVIDGDYFWQYAKRSPFYETILNNKKMFGEKEKAEKEAAATEILAHAERIVASDNTFLKRLNN